MSSHAVKWVRNQHGLTATERNVLIEIAWKIREPEDHSAPSIKEIAKLIERKPNTVKKIIASLVRKNFLLIEHTFRADGGQHRNHYRLNFSRKQIDVIEQIYSKKGTEFDDSICCDCGKPSKLSPKTVDKPVEKTPPGGFLSTPPVDGNQPGYYNILNTFPTTVRATTDCTYFDYMEDMKKKCHQEAFTFFEGKKLCESHYDMIKRERYKPESRRIYDQAIM